MYFIIGKYQDQFEVIDEVYSLDEAIELSALYEIEYGPEWDITIEEEI
jgi:hypothetical protein